MTARVRKGVGMDWPWFIAERAKREANHADGGCYGCGGTPDKEGYVICDACSDRERGRFQSPDFCAYCGQPWTYLTGSGCSSSPAWPCEIKRCTPCRDRATEDGVVPLGLVQGGLL